MTAAVLAVFCLHWPAALPGQIDRAAHAASVPSVLLAATVGAESTCDNRKTSRVGAIGLGQILPSGSAAKGHSARQLRRKRLNLRLAAEHLHKGLQLCGGNWAQAVSFYAGVWPCAAGPWGLRVAGAAMQSRIAMEERR
jgi:soluble lytic murein transglycosylase-like protein